MIVVVGALDGASGDGVTAAAIARRAAANGAAVEVVAIVPADAAGDRRILSLARDGVAHRAVLRSPARALEPADLELALRYLPDVGAIVLVEPAEALVATAGAAAAWSGAGLVIVSGGAAPDGAPDAPDPDDTDRSGAIVLAPPTRDPDGAFAGLVAAVAERLAAGASPAEAWSETSSALAIEPARTSGSARVG